MSAFGAERKPTFDIGCFRFCPIADPSSVRRIPILPTLICMQDGIDAVECSVVGRWPLRQLIPWYRHPRIVLLDDQPAVGDLQQHLTEAGFLHGPFTVAVD
jgi:hypothetical protein